MTMTISAGEFKAKCLKLMDTVHESRDEILITKYGKPIAKLLGVKSGNFERDAFGYLKGTVTILGDITEPIDVKWEAME